MPALHTRSKYDTSVIYLYFHHKEYLLSEALRNSIPYSTITTWRKNDPSHSYVGYEIRPKMDEAFEFIELTHERDTLKKVLKVFMKSWISIAHIVTPVLTKHKQHKDIVLNEVQRLITVIPKRIALKLAGLSSNAYHYRLNTLNRLCHDSAFALCLRRHPLQLSLKELGVMKQLINDARFICWPVCSIAYFAQRNNLLGISLSTWYKYLPAIGFKRKTKLQKETHAGLVTTAPNQFLHVDTTFWNIEHGVKAAIVFVTDNFSKAILGWNISLHKNADNVTCALNNAIQTIHQFHPDHVCTTLMADGGKENHNKTIDELLATTTNPCITKIIAQKDISFSNAAIEAINKIIKVYLRHYKPSTLPQLMECVRLAVYDYCYLRPHGALKGMIPMEVYANQQTKIDTGAYMIQSKIRRIEQNRKHGCGTCK